MLNRTMKLAVARRQTGFSLLEILVTIIIVAVGSLGIAGTIITGMQATASSAERNIATQQIAAFIEAMGTNTYMKERTTGAGVGYGTPWDGVFTAPGCYAGGCSVVQLHLQHLDTFRTNVANMLPNGKIRVQGTGTTPPMIAVTVAWVEQSTGSKNLTNASSQHIAASSGCDPANLPPYPLNQCLTITVPGF
jgi:type IV pilus assembly protein PilV